MNIWLKRILKLWNRWTRPRSTHIEERMQEYVVRVVLLVTHLISPLFGIIALLFSFYGVIPYDTPLILFFITIALGLALKLCDIGCWKMARAIPPFLVGSTAIYGNWIAGIDAPANLLYALTVILVSILFDGRRWIIVLLIVLLAHSGISFLHHIGMIKVLRGGEQFFYNRVIINVAGISAIAILVYFIISRLKQALDAASLSSAQLEKLLAENKLLLKEMHHRVKNNLQLMQSLLQLQANLIEKPELQEVLKGTLNRLRSMAITHEQLYGNKDLSKVNFDLYVNELIENIMTSFAMSKDQVILDCRIEQLHLELYKAIPCGLILNELITNAFKHAFAKLRQGKLTVEFYKKDKNFHLMVGDNGPGIQPKQENQQSLGLTLVDLLCKQLKGEVVRENDNGLKVTIRFPV